jgi:hypothetical protein
LNVVFIAGPSRSGSTFLSNVLGEIDGFFNAGELIDIWDRGVLSDGTCGCGAPVSSCAVWQSVLQAAYAGQLPDLELMVKLRDSAARSCYVPWYAMVPSAKDRLRRRVRPYCDAVEKLYYGIQASTGCRYIVDSSKNLGYAHLLSLIPGLHVYILLLIRDPRATAYSWRRKKEGLWQARPAKVTLTWMSRNITGEAFGSGLTDNYMRLLYEDFVRSPRPSVDRVLEFLEAPPCETPFVGGDEVELGLNHCIYGNPGRFKTGRFRVKMDDEWKTKIKKSDRLTVNLLTWPLLLRYGYLLR